MCIRDSASSPASSNAKTEFCDSVRELLCRSTFKGRKSSSTMAPKSSSRRETFARYFTVPDEKTPATTEDEHFTAKKEHVDTLPAYGAIDIYKHLEILKRAARLIFNTFAENYVFKLKQLIKSLDEKKNYENKDFMRHFNKEIKKIANCRVVEDMLKRIRKDDLVAAIDGSGADKNKNQPARCGFIIKKCTSSDVKCTERFKDHSREVFSIGERTSYYAERESLNQLLNELLTTVIPNNSNNNVSEDNAASPTINNKYDDNNNNNSNNNSNMIRQVTIRPQNSSIG